MANRLEKIRQEHTDQPWIKARVLEEIGAIFTIKEVDEKPKQGKIGPQWEMTIDIDEDTLPDVDLKVKDIHNAVLQFSKGSRDDFIDGIRQAIAEDGPLYNCYIENSETKGGNEFFNIKMLNEDEDGYVEPPVYVKPEAQSNGRRRATGRQAQNTSKHSNSSQDEERSSITIDQAMSGDWNPEQPRRRRAPKETVETNAINHLVTTEDVGDPFLDADDLP